MKFIRDIISEKTRLSAESGTALPHSESNLFLPQTEAQPPESDLDSVDINQSFRGASETTSLADKRTATPVSWDAFTKNERSEADGEPEFIGEAGFASDEDARNLFDAVDSMDVEYVESLFQDDAPNGVQDVAQPDSDHATGTTVREIIGRAGFVGSKPPTIDEMLAEPQLNSAETKVVHPRKERLPDPQVVPDDGAKNEASSASVEIPAVPTPQPEQPQSPRADASNFVAGLAEMVNVPAPAVGRGAARAGRVKTRLLGFNHRRNAASDPFANRTQQSAAGITQFPVGWLIVVDGPGEGSAFTLFDGVSQIGRGSDQTVCLDFGDNSISRENHAVVAYDSENKKFFLGHGGKTNLVRLENRPVLSTEEMVSGNEIRIGETTLRFVGLCGSEFQWKKTPREDRQNATFS